MSAMVLVVPTMVPKVRKELGIEGVGKGRKKNLFLKLLGFPSVDEFFDLYREIWRYVEDWDSLDEEKKEKLKRFAYAMLEMEEERNKVISKYVRNPFDRLKIYLICHLSLRGVQSKSGETVRYGHHDSKNR